MHKKQQILEKQKIQQDLLQKIKEEHWPRISKRLVEEREERREWEEQGLEKRKRRKLKGKEYEIQQPKVRGREEQKQIAEEYFREAKSKANINNININNSGVNNSRSKNKNVYDLERLAQEERQEEYIRKQQISIICYVMYDSQGKENE